MTQEKNKAREEAGFDVAAGGQAKATCENVLQKDDSASLSAQKKNDILASKSTSTEVQLEKALHLLRAGPKTTVELRDHGIMMPAARIHHFRHVDGFHGIGYFCVWQLTTAHRASDQLAGLVRTLGTHPNRLFSPVRRLHSRLHPKGVFLTLYLLLGIHEKQRICRGARKALTSGGYCWLYKNSFWAFQLILLWEIHVRLPARAAILMAIVFSSQAFSQMVIQADMAKLQPQISRDEGGYKSCGVRAVVIAEGEERFVDMYDFSMNVWAAPSIGLMKAGKSRTTKEKLQQGNANRETVMPAPVNFWIALESEGKALKLQQGKFD